MGFYMRSVTSNDSLKVCLSDERGLYGITFAAVQGVPLDFEAILLPGNWEEKRRKTAILCLGEIREFYPAFKFGILSNK